MTIEGLTALRQNVIEGEADLVPQLVQAALDAGEPAEVILKQGLIAAMDEVGRQFEAGDFFVPEMLFAARAMQAGLVLLKPRLQQSEVKAAGRVVIGTVHGDMHDIGKNLVAMMLEGAGFEVVDLGIDVPPDRFVEAIRQHAPQLLGMSALLTTTMLQLTVTLQALEAAGVRQQVKVMVGGAPVTEAFAQKIGADGYAADASRAVGLAKALVGGA